MPESGSQKWYELELWPQVIYISINMASRCLQDKSSVRPRRPSQAASAPPSHFLRPNKGVLFVQALPVLIATVVMPLIEFVPDDFPETILYHETHTHTTHTQILSSGSATHLLCVLQQITFPLWASVSLIVKWVGSAIPSLLFLPLLIFWNSRAKYRTNRTSHEHLWDVCSDQEKKKYLPSAHSILFCPEW